MDCKELRELYANLLASSMTKSKSSDVHPSFVDIIRQMSADDVHTLEEMKINNTIYASKFEYVKNKERFLCIDNIIDNQYTKSIIGASSTIDNLVRLGIIYFDPVINADSPKYKSYFKSFDKKISSLIDRDILGNQVTAPGVSKRITHKVFSFTTYGATFCSSCTE